MLAPDARLWFENRTGEGQPLDPDPGAGSWARWDTHFRSTSEVVEWAAQRDSATALVREFNDYYALLERGPQHYSMTYFIETGGRISGVLLRGEDPRPKGRSAEFFAWARANAPKEVDQLMPGGKIDPRGDHPQRFRDLLTRWRTEIGLPPLGAE
jgi:hypothetical protein